MTSSLQLIMVRLHHSFFSTYLVHLILSIIPSFSLVFEIGSVLVILLNGSHLISPLALRQSQSMIPSLHSLLSLLWYTPRFRTWSTPFHSLYNSSWLVDLKESLKYHLNADETQLYITFKFHSYEFCSISWNTTTFTDILSWMNLNKLLLNPSKTEFLLIGIKQRLKFSDLTNLTLSNYIIPFSSSTRNLNGFIFDSDMAFSDQINSVPKSCQFHIQDISRFRHLRSSSFYSHVLLQICSCKFSCLQQT